MEEEQGIEDDDEHEEDIGSDEGFMAVDDEDHEGSECQNGGDEADRDRWVDGYGVGRWKVLQAEVGNREKMRVRRGLLLTVLRPVGREKVEMRCALSHIDK